MTDQVTALCRAGYYLLRKLRPVTRSLPEECAKTLVETFISRAAVWITALQRPALRHQRQSVEASAVDPECDES